MINVDAPTLLMIAAAYLIAALVKGVTGLGFSSTCLPILVFAVGLKTALPLVIIPSIASNLVVMRQAGDIVGAVRQFWPMLIATVPGLLIGLYFLSAVDAGRLAAALGLVLILYALFTLT
ncbi:MAG: TSUP family transporter, partial [Pseudomonadota bacterium]